MLTSLGLVEHVCNLYIYIYIIYIYAHCAPSAVSYHILETGEDLFFKICIDISWSTATINLNLIGSYAPRVH